MLKSLAIGFLKFSKNMKVFVSFIILIFLIYGVVIYKNKTEPVPVFAIGDLGGVPVAIPNSYAKFVEYNQDPSPMKEREESPKGRNYQSKLSSFGFEVRYPDMASDSSAQSKESIFTTKWMRVGITAGDAYGSSGDVSLDRRLAFHLDASRQCKSKCFIYVPMQEKIYGLTGYTPTGSGVDIEGRKVNFGRGTDLRDRNIYVHKDMNGKVRTLIECGNRAHEAERCQHYFNLDPEIKAHVRITYRKSLLQNWKNIQASIAELIYSFRVKTNDYK